MKHQYVIVFFALIITSSMVSFTSYRATEREVNEDMSQALALDRKDLTLSQRQV